MSFASHPSCYKGAQPKTRDANFRFSRSPFKPMWKIPLMIYVARNVADRKKPWGRKDWGGRALPQTQ